MEVGQVVDAHGESEGLGLCPILLLEEIILGLAAGKLPEDHNRHATHSIVHAVVVAYGNLHDLGGDHMVVVEPDISRDQSLQLLALAQLLNAIFRKIIWVNCHELSSFGQTPSVDEQSWHLVRHTTAAKIEK